MADIFFDLDGVLIRSRNRDKTFLWSENIDRELKIEQPVRELLFRQPEWGEIICGRVDFVPYLKNIFATHQVSTPVEDFICYWLENDLNWHREVLDLLTRLKQAGHHLFIASNQDRLRSRFIRDQSETKNTFSGIFTSSDLGVAKPEIKFFQKLKEAAGERLRGTPLMIDDASSNIISAREAGFKAIHFDPDLEPGHTAIWLGEQIEARLL